MRTSTLRGAPRCAAPAAAWRRSEACGSAALGGARRRSVTLSGAQRPRRRGGARQHVAQQRSAALGGARLPSAALGGAQRPRQHGGARQHVAARIVALGNDRFGTCSGARTPALGGVPLHSAEVRRRLGRRRWLATRPLRRRLLGAGLGRRQVAGRPYFLRGPRVRSHARSSGPFPSRFSGPRPQWQTLMPFTRRFSGPLPQVQTMTSCRRFSGPLPCTDFSAVTLVLGSRRSFFRTRALAVHQPAALLVSAGYTCRGRYRCTQ